MFKRNKLSISVSRAIIALTALSSPAFAIELTALPDVDNANIVYGSAAFDKSGNTLNIDSTASSGTNGNTLINWGGTGFNVGKEATVNFELMNDRSIIVNHDMSGTMSTINGNINSPRGSVVVVNQNGIEHTGAGTASLTLLAGRPGEESFGLDNENSRISVIFEQSSGKLISSNIENMTGVNSSYLGIKASMPAEIHSNANSLMLSGADQGDFLALHLRNSKLYNSELYLNALSDNHYFVSEAGDITVENSLIAG